MEALYEINAVREIATWNADADHLFGWPAAEDIGMPAHRLVRERNRARGSIRLDEERRLSPAPQPAE